MKKIKYNQDYLIANFEGVDFYIAFFKWDKSYARLNLKIGKTYLADFTIKLYRVKLDMQWKLSASEDDFGFNDDLNDKLDEAIKKMLKEYHF